MKTISAICLTALLVSSPLSAEEKAALHTRQIDVDTRVVTSHQTTIKGKKISYTATAGTQPVWNTEGEAVATLFYTYYQRTEVKNRANRPLLISFNGGPGSASVWMHVAYTGPRSLRVDDEGYPIQPYGVKDNPFSVLDVADIVFVNPVNTGYSRVLKDKEGKLPSKDAQKALFFGVTADVKYLAEWLSNFVTRNNRWQSAKYLIGESYGTTRVSGLALELQNSQWMYLNGVILVSPTDIGIKREGPVKSANRLPYFAAAAWYHKALNAHFQQKDLLELLAEAEDFAINDYMPALARGGSLSPETRVAIAEKVAGLSGLSLKSVLQNNLDISNTFFWKELLRERSLTVGRLDSRYLGMDNKDSGDRPDYWPELTSWLHSFTPAINHYLRGELEYVTDIKYNMFGDVHPWDRTGNKTGENLRLAMAQNPYLNVMIQSGYYDGATNYFDAKYTMWQLNTSGDMGKRLRFKGYRSGHMMYLRRADLEAANEDIRLFISDATPGQNEAARY